MKPTVLMTWRRMFEAYEVIQPTSTAALIRSSRAAGQEAAVSTDGKTDATQPAPIDFRTAGEIVERPQISHNTTPGQVMPAVIRHARRVVRSGSNAD